MYREISLGKYINKSSKIHEINPVIKIICTIIFVVSVFISKTIEMHLFLYLLLLILMLRTNISVKKYIKDLKFLRMFFIFLIIINLIFKSSILEILFLISKLVLIVLYTGILTKTTKTTELVYGLKKTFGFVEIFKININLISENIIMAIKFIPIIFEEQYALMKIGMLKGMFLKNIKIKSRIENYGLILTKSITNGINNADNYSDALELKFYNPNNKRTYYKMNKPKKYDYFILFTHSIILLAFIIERIV